VALVSADGITSPQLRIGRTIRNVTLLSRRSLGLYVPLICIVSLPILIAGVIIYRTNGFYFPAGGIELPIFWAIVQVIQAMLGPRAIPNHAACLVAGPN
jgi:hypothetical protein